jgi:hypothetical protein
MNPDAAPRIPDKRRIPRIPMGVTILIPHLQLKLLCHNLSNEGCFFKETDLGPMGETFFLFLDPPEIGIIIVEGRIAHKGEDGKGTGIEFISIDPPEKIRLAYFLEIFQ